MKTFKDLTNKWNKLVSSHEKSHCFYAYAKMNLEIQTDLGEWAWKVIEEWVKEIISDYSNNSVLAKNIIKFKIIKMNNVVYQIACACLGEAEVKKRLEKLLESEEK